MASLKKLFDSWEKLEIRKTHVMQCEYKAQNSLNKTTQDYWWNCRNFLNELKTKNFDTLTIKQKRWARKIVSEVFE